MMMNEIEITHFEPEPITTRSTVNSASEAEALVREGADTASYVLVARHEGEVSLGEFHIWLSGDRAIVRLDEHRERYATHPARISSIGGGEIWFRDVDGMPFPAQVAETVTRSRALEALNQWLRTGEMLPGLAWA